MTWNDMLRDEISEASDRLAWYAKQPSRLNASFVGITCDNMINYMQRVEDPQQAVDLIAQAVGLVTECYKVEQKQRAANGDAMADGVTWLNQVI
jgi:hypothetical protein